MGNSIITTEGIYTKGIVIPRVKPSGRRSAIVTFLSPRARMRIKSDEELWKEIDPILHRVREKIFRETHPDLYQKYAKRKRA